MSQNQTPLRGWDNRSSTFLTDSGVVRVINQEFLDSTRLVVARLGDNPTLDGRVVKFEISAEGSNTQMLHPSLPIVYPQEWTFRMLLEAAQLTLNLGIILARNRLALKDALPSNVIFYKGHPVFVDFSSLVPIEELPEEGWLVQGGASTDPRDLILRSMFLPFFLVPLLVGHFNSSAKMRSLLTEKYCNSGYRPGRSDLLKNNRWSSPFRADGKYREISRELKHRCFPTSYRFLGEQLALLDCHNILSPYKDYYKNKNIEHDWSNQQSWNFKQIHVARILEELGPESVLDVGCNTGWYSVLASKLGARRVIGTDLDEQLIDELNSLARELGIDVTGAILSFQCFMSEDSQGTARFPISQNFRPFLSAGTRYKSDVVLCLALLHHLVLGQGLSLKEVLATLRLLATDTVILEYVSQDDLLVVANPSFFPKLARMSGQYSLEKLLYEAQFLFSEIEILSSETETRKIIKLSDKKTS